MKQKKGLISRAIGMLLVFTVLCGVFYTGLITAAAQLLFPHSANGSIIEVDGKAYGSVLLGQYYTDDSHMWGRMMNIDTQLLTHNGKPVLYAHPTNAAVTSPEYEAQVAQRVEKILQAHPDMAGTPIPADLVTASGSGLDPHISVQAANYQAQRLAKNNHITVDQVQEIINRCTEDGLLGVMGQRRVNVLKVNLILDGILK